MKLVTFCHEGLNRSVTAKWLLQYKDHEVIAAGINCLTEDTLQMLFDWADKVIVLDARLAEDVPADKLVLWDVGPDRFSRPFNPELLGILRGYLAATPDL